jgi:MOSC domain-containing protein YiiM
VTANRIVSLQVGLPRVMDPHGRPWTTATFKDPVFGKVALSTLGLAGDGQADLESHGGPDKAVLVYSEAHAERWRRELFPEGLPPAAFGENFTVQGLTEANVCVGDTFDVGSARVQVSQPRQPCWKQARRYAMNDLIARIVRTGRTGWYLRVLREGLVEAGDVLTLIDRLHPKWTIEKANHVMYAAKSDRELNLELADIPEMSRSWSTYLRHRFS